LHLSNQKEAAVEKTGCKYRTTRGLKCAIGCLIPDYKYSTRFEGINVSSLLSEVPNLARDMYISPKHSLELLIQLQLAHDVTLARRGITEWLEAMELIAARFNLEMISLIEGNASLILSYEGCEV